MVDERERYMMFMKILFFQWDSYMDQGIECALKRLEIDYDTYAYQFVDWEEDDRFLETFHEHLKSKSYQLVLSMNFSPLISKVCEELKVLYIAWVYDSLYHIRDLSALGNSYTKAYLFDRGQAEEFKKKEFHVEYLPLAVDPAIFCQIASEQEKGKYDADLSFSGKMYRSKYQNWKASLNEYLQGYLEGVISAQMKIYGGYLIPELVTHHLVNQINEDCFGQVQNNFQIGERELEYMLACEVTGRERYIALALLSEKYKTYIYSEEKDDRLIHATYCAYTDFCNQMAAVYSCSRINLNISLRTIRTGIPLRVLNIMGCGGFVLSNYQEELAEYFVPGEECVIYESLEDLYEKVRFYLNNDAERRRVAHNGFEKVKRDFSFDDRIKTMFKDYNIKGI